MDQYNREQEQNLLEMIRQKEQSDKRLLTAEWVIGILSVLVLFIPIVISECLPMEDWQRIVLALSGVLPALAGLCFAVWIEQVAGYYECKECGHRYVPTYKAVNLAPHAGRTRYMRCPECGKKSWQEKVLRKE